MALAAAAVFFLTPVLALGVGVRPAKFENRALTPAPSISSGWGFFTGLAAWATDELPFRDVAVRFNDRLSRDVFGESSLVDNRRPASGPVVAPVAPPAAADVQLPVAGYPKVIEGTDGWLYYGYDVEGKCAPLRPLDDVLRGLGRLRAAVEASGRRFVLVVAPDKTTVVPEHLPGSFIGRQCAQARSAQFWHRMNTEADAIDLRPALGALAKAGVPVFNKLDTHWTDAGSLTMVRALADTVTPGVSRSWRVEPAGQRPLDADLPRLLGRSGTDQVPMYSLAPDGQRDRTGPYLGHMRTPYHFGSAPTSGMVRTPVSMVTDSFSLPASRYLGAAFSDLTAVYYETADTNLDEVANVLASGKVVIFEVVERDLAGGLPHLLDDAAIDHVAAVLKARPVN